MALSLPNQGLSQDRRQKVLAVASAGGHWTQLLRLKPAFESSDIVYVSTRSQGTAVEGFKFYQVTDANKDSKASLVKLSVSILVILLKERPDIVLSTGAAPGLVALFFARFFGAKTIWLDSLANVERLSLSGRLARRYSHLYLTQWPHLAKPDGPSYIGSVI